MKTFHRLLLENLIETNVNRFANNTLDVGSKNRRYDCLLHKPSVAIDLVPNKDLNVLYGDVTQLKFNNTFDQIFCFEVLEYLDCNRIILSVNHLIRSLKKGGVLLLSTPFNVAEHNERTRLSENWWKELFDKLDCDGSWKVVTFGNATTVSFDCELYTHRRKEKIGIMKKIGYAYLNIKRQALIFLQKHMMHDKFYSGVFIIYKK